MKRLLFDATVVLALCTGGIYIWGLSIVQGFLEAFGIPSSAIDTN